MGFHLNAFGGIFLIVLLASPSSQDVHVGVDMVTKLSNNLIHMIFKEGSIQTGNHVTSPFGLLSNLAMVMEASSNKTRTEFLQMLNITSKDVADLRKGFRAYCELFLKYSNEPEAAGSFNSASFSSSFKLNTTYKEILQKYYCANVSESLTSDEAVLEVGSIAGVMTHWKDYEKLAVYTFLSHQPLNAFKKRDGSSVSVPMIPQVGVFKTRPWENSQIILLPLQAKLVDLLLVVPDNPEEGNVVMRKLNEFTIPLLVQTMPKQEAEVFIPQMAIVSRNYNFTSLLVRNGIRRVFDVQKADLKRASFNSSDDVVLNKVEQNAFFSTSFVALNSVSGVSSSMEVHRRTKRDAKKIYIDRPFYFFILHKDTQLVLLAGRVENPSQVPS